MTLKDKISALEFHHIEFYAGDATAAYKRMMYSLGLELVAKSEFSSGNNVFASYMLQSGNTRMLFTAPYGQENETEPCRTNSIPGFDPEIASRFFQTHGLGVRAVALTVKDVYAAYAAMMHSNATSVLKPCRVMDQAGRGWCDWAEVKLYGDLVLRLLNTDNFRGNTLPNFDDVPAPVKDTAASGALSDIKDGKDKRKPGKFGIERIDHVVGNVWSLERTLVRLKNITVIRTDIFRI